MKKNTLKGLSVLFSKWFNAKCSVLVLLSLLIIIWELPYLYTWDKIAISPEDQDYFFQAYEAIRKTIIEYHQFPWVNPWVGGGVPLFANPQVGVFSPQTILVLIFGTVPGLKLSVVLYSLLGALGASLFFKRDLRTTLPVAALLAFCWIANGFFVGHLLEHYSFVYFLLFPLALHLQLNILKRRYAIYYGVFLGVFALTSLHYAFLQMALILSVIAIIQLLLKIKKWAILKIYIYRFGITMAIFLALAFVRILYTLQYVSEFPRTYNESSNSFVLLLYGLFTPGQNANFIHGSFLLGNQYGPWEYSAYVGFGVGAILLYLIAKYMYDVGKIIIRRGHLSVTRPQIYIGGALLAALVFGSVALGEYDGFSAWSAIHALPGFSNTRVPSRWLLWVGFSFLCILALSSAQIKQTKKFMIMLGFAALELYVVGFWYPRHQFDRQATIFRPVNAGFVQYEHYSPLINTNNELNKVKDSGHIGKGGPYFAYEATLNNIGELYGYEPVYSTQQDKGQRCGVNSACSLIMTKNAEIEKWSPNKILLRRTAAGPIVMNIAPSNYWIINGVRLEKEKNVTGPGNLVVRNTSSIIELVARPKSLAEIIRD